MAESALDSDPDLGLAAPVVSRDTSPSFQDKRFEFATTVEPQALNICQFLLHPCRDCSIYFDLRRQQDRMKIQGLAAPPGRLKTA